MLELFLIWFFIKLLDGFVGLLQIFSHSSTLFFSSSNWTAHGKSLWIRFHQMKMVFIPLYKSNGVKNLRYYWRNSLEVHWFWYTAQYELNTKLQIHVHYRQPKKQILEVSILHCSRMYSFLYWNGNMMAKCSASVYNTYWPHNGTVLYLCLYVMFCNPFCYGIHIRWPLSWAKQEFSRRELKTKQFLTCQCTIRHAQSILIVLQHNWTTIKKFLKWYCIVADETKLLHSKQPL